MESCREKELTKIQFRRFVRNDSAIGQHCSCTSDCIRANLHMFATFAGDARNKQATCDRITRICIR